MQTKEGRPSTSPELSQEDVALGSLMAIWQHGEAARADPVLLNMQARIAAASRVKSSAGVAADDAMSAASLPDRVLRQEVDDAA